MKYFSTTVLKIITGLFLLLPAVPLEAQRRSVYDENNKVKSVETRRYEESIDNQNRTNNRPASATKTPLTQAETDANRAEARKLAAEKLKASYGRFDYIGPVDENGLSPVQLRNKWGYQKGYDNLVIPIQYQDLKFDGFGFYGVKLNNKWGFVDKTGKVVVPITYSRIVSGYNRKGKFGYCKLSDGWNAEVYINNQGIVLSKEQAWRMDNNGYDTKGLISEGLINVSLDNKHGYIDAVGSVILPFIYDAAGRFNNGLAAVKLGQLWGFIDKTGKPVTPIKYEGAGDLYQGTAVIKLNNKYGYIDVTGKEIIPLIYDEVKNAAYGFHALRSGNKWRFIKPGSTALMNEEYDEIISNFAMPPSTPSYGDKPVNNSDNATAVVVKNFQQYAIDQSGREIAYTKKEVAPKGYDTSAAYNDDGLASVKLNGKWGMINKKGEVVVPLMYDYQLYVLNGLVRVLLNRKVGYIDLTGKEIIAIKYDDVGGFFNSDISWVKANGKYGMIDKTGKEIIAVKYDMISSYFGGETFSVQLHNKWGLIDKTEKEIIEIKYDEKCDVDDMFSVTTDNAYGVNRYGKEIIALSRKTESSGNGVIYFKLEDKFYKFDYYGKKLRK